MVDARERSAAQLREAVAARAAAAAADQQMAQHGAACQHTLQASEATVERLQVCGFALRCLDCWTAVGAHIASDCI